MSTNLISSDQIFSSTERRVIAAIADATVFEDAMRNLPAASDPLVLGIILEKAAHFGARLQADLAALQTVLDPLAVSPAELLEVLERNPRFRSLSRIMTIVIMQAYYQDARVLQALGLSARPPFPLGHEVPDGDWSMLTPVQQRGKIYRDV